MEIRGYCKNCGNVFDAHWHNFLGSKIQCPECYSLFITRFTDESEVMRPQWDTPLDADENSGE